MRIDKRKFFIPNLIKRQIGENYIYHDVKTGCISVLNQTAAMIFECIREAYNCNSDISSEKIVGKLIQDFDVRSISDTELIGDVRKIIEELNTTGLLKIEY